MQKICILHHKHRLHTCFEISITLIHTLLNINLPPFSYNLTKKLYRSFDSTLSVCYTLRVASFLCALSFCYYLRRDQGPGRHYDKESDFEHSHWWPAAGRDKNTYKKHETTQKPKHHNHNATKPNEDMIQNKRRRFSAAGGDVLLYQTAPCVHTLLEQANISAPVPTASSALSFTFALCFLFCFLPFFCFLATSTCLNLHRDRKSVV